jgi:hypothetical protein
VTTELKRHPASAIFPDMNPGAFAAFKEDIRQRGQLEAIRLYEGMILDGWHRYLACVALGIEPRVVEWDGDDPVGYVLSMNLKRRDLTKSQKAMVAARAANMRHGSTLKQYAEVSIDTSAISMAAAAREAQVSRPLVARAKAVVDKGVPELVEAVDKGAITVDAASRVAQLPEQEQRDLVAKGPGGVTQMASRIRAAAAGKRPGKKQKPENGRQHKMSGKQFVAQDEGDTFLADVRSLRKWLDDRGGFKNLVSKWENERRWIFCDELEALGKRLLLIATQCRHHSKV